MFNFYKPQDSFYKFFLDFQFLLAIFVIVITLNEGVFINFDEDNSTPLINTID